MCLYECMQNERIFKTCTTVQVVEWNGNTKMAFMYNRKQGAGVHQFIFDVDQSQTHIYTFIFLEWCARVCVFFSFFGIYFAGSFSTNGFHRKLLITCACQTEATPESTFSEDEKDVDLVLNPFNFLLTSDYAIVM